MRLHYYKDPYGNVGDDLNPWLWPQLAPELIDDDGRTLLVGIGTLLRRDLPASPGKVVFGSGAGYGAPPVVDGTWQIYCVRGPRTASVLGIDPALAISDPALLVRALMPPIDPSTRRGIGFMPHHESILRAAAQDIDLAGTTRRSGFAFIDPRDAVAGVLDQIRRCRRVVTEAMHGAILADAFRVPWIPVRLYGHVLRSKWIDWTESMALSYDALAQPHPQPDASDFDAFLKECARMSDVRSQLSDEAISNERLGSLGAALERLKRDARDGRVVRGVASEVRHDTARGIPDGEASWWHAVARALREIAQAIPSGAPVALADDGQWAVDDRTVGPRIVRLPALSSEHEGAPIDASAARAMLANARERGYRHVAFGWPALWWLDAYDGLRDELTQGWRQTHASALCLVYEAAQ
jgi:succinoglycan biosynthesis protein ExoV